MLAKNLPSNRKWVIMIRIMLDAIAAFKGLLSGDGVYFNSIFKAHLAFLKWLLFHPQKRFLPIQKTGELQGVLQKNLIWQFFINKKKTFAEIVRKS